MVDGGGGGGSGGGGGGDGWNEMLHDNENKYIKCNFQQNNKNASFFWNSKTIEEK